MSDQYNPLNENEPIGNGERIDNEVIEEKLTPEEIEQLALEEKAQEERDSFVNYIYHQTSNSKVTGEKKLKLSPPSGLTKEKVEEFLAEIGKENGHIDFEDINRIEGKKDRYLYDLSIMTVQYAQLEAMLEDKDMLHTIAQITRSDSKMYPRPTQFKKLKDTPFHFTEDEILGAIARMQLEKDYEDIGVVTASNGAQATYSTLHLSKKYAQSLIEYIEVEEPNNP